MASESEDVNVNIDEKKQKRLLLEILKLYKDFPCLWDKSDELYSNKGERNHAWSIILQKWQTCYPLATTAGVKKKLEHLRAAYRRERNKVESSKFSGLHVHIPSLWYYPYLTFLHEKTKTTSEENERIDSLSESEDSNYIEELATAKEKSSINTLYTEQESETLFIQNSSLDEESSEDIFASKPQFTVDEITQAKLEVIQLQKQILEAELEDKRKECKFKERERKWKEEEYKLRLEKLRRELQE